MITETLSASRGQRPTATAISDSALKVVFLTTLYVDVKEPAVQYILATKKLNLMRTWRGASLTWNPSNATMRKADFSTPQQGEGVREIVPSTERPSFRRRTSRGRGPLISKCVISSTMRGVVPKR